MMSEPNPNLDDSDSAHEIDADLEREINEALGDETVEQLMEKNAAAPTEDAEAQEAAGDQNESPSPEHVGFELKRGRVAKIDGDDVFIDLFGIDSKLQGIVPLKQFDRSPRMGSIMDFVLQRVDEGEGLIYLSREGAVTVTAWDQLTRGLHVEARVVSTNKGGLELEMAGRIRGFMPASHVDLHHVDQLDTFIGQKLSATVQEVDRRGRRVVLSRRRYLEEQRTRLRKTLLNELEVDQTRQGTVTRLVKYGAFVDLGGLDGLVHISDLSYSRVEDPTDVLKVGQEITVKVLQIDAEDERVRLGLKQVEPDPWDGIAGQHHVGDQITARVLSITTFGAFVEIEPGIDALLPISEMSWQRIVKPDSVCKEGDVLKVVILQIDTDKRRISVSLKQAQNDPWQEVEQKYPKNQLLEGTVVRTTDFGAFIEIETGLEGLVHISEMADRHIKNVAEVVKVGEKHQFRVLDVSQANRRISLSLKAVAEPSSESDAIPEASPQQRAKKKPDKPLKGGMDKRGGMGMGLKDLKL